MEKAFYAVSGETVWIQRGYRGQERLPKLLSIWEKKLNATSPILQRAFVDMNYEELRKLYHTLLEIPSLREYIVCIFINHLRMDVPMTHRITQRFTEFIRGITTFLTEKRNALPLYHRLDSPECYLDHLIYNHMVQHFNIETDDAYRRWLKKAQNKPVVIDMTYEDAWPIELIVWRDGYKETYRRKLTGDYVIGIYYEDLVVAMREKTNEDADADEDEDEDEDEDADTVWFNFSTETQPGSWVPDTRRSPSPAP